MGPDSFIGLFHKREAEERYRESEVKKAQELEKRNAEERREAELRAKLASVKEKKREEFPDDFREIRAFRCLGGSSNVEAGFWKNEEECFVVKRAREANSEDQKKQHELQLQDEYIADAVYRTLGLLTPQSQIYENGGAKVSRFLEGKLISTFDSDSEKGRQIQKELQKGFVADCFLANWDVIGGAEDNILVGENGEVYRIDNGGALRFRARGERKGDDFGSTVGELTTLRGKKWFQGITQQEIWGQVEELLKKRDRILDEVFVSAVDAGMEELPLHELLDTLQKRMDYLAEYAKTLTEEARKDKGKYESGVTNAYFETWDALHLEGNKGIKDAISENITEAEKQQASAYETLASKHTISVEEYKKRLQEKVEQLVNESMFFRATETCILENVMLNDGRWKSQFETSRSNGCLNSDWRGRVERAMFGFNRTANESELTTKDKEKRPIYGYFSNGEYGEINSEGKIPPPNNTSQYGKITFKIKRNVALSKATLTFTDSLGRTEQRRIVATPAAKPHFTSFYLDDGHFDPLEYQETKRPHYSYTETQYHNQLRIEDIEAIYVTVGNGVLQPEVETVRELYRRILTKTQILI